jgi:hypothetical protein
MMSWFSSITSWISNLFFPSLPDGGDPEKVAKIQAAAVKICGFLPMAETVAQILGTANPAVFTVSSVANSICKAVTKTPMPTPIAASLMSGAKEAPQTYGTVNGVPVQGVFVGK